MVTLHTLSLVHKVRCVGEPEVLAREFRTVAETRERSTRQDHDLIVPRSRTEMGKRRFCSRAALLYNTLPSDVQRLPLSPFKRALSAISNVSRLMTELGDGCGVCACMSMTV